MTQEEEDDLERSTGAVAYYAKQQFYCQKRGMHSYPGFAQLPVIERESWQYVADAITGRETDPLLALARAALAHAIANVAYDRALLEEEPDEVAIEQAYAAYEAAEEDYRGRLAALGATYKPR